MNRNPDGSLLSCEDLAAIAVANGAPADVLMRLRGDLHKEELVRSALAQKTRAACFSMFTRGELGLDSRTPANSPGFVEPPRTIGGTIAGGLDRPPAEPRTCRVDAATLAWARSCAAQACQG